VFFFLPRLHLNSRGNAKLIKEGDPFSDTGDIRIKRCESLYIYRSSFTCFKLWMMLNKACNIVFFKRFVISCILNDFYNNTTNLRVVRAYVLTLEILKILN
jgi:hypothetical protein